MPDDQLRWKCTRFGHVMAQNLPACPVCFYTVFAPVKPWQGDACNRSGAADSR
jgi:hypothetical protein